MQKFLLTVPDVESSRANILYPAYCCTRIAACFRGARTLRRFKYLKYPVYHIAALLVQNAYRQSYQMRYLNESSYLSDNMSPEDKAAKMIQDMWRSGSGVKIYKFYRDLINFRLTGDPRLLLKTINPAEACLFDAATKIHIRCARTASAQENAMLRNEP